MAQNMIAYIKDNQSTTQINFDGSEGDLFKKVGEHLLTVSIPNTIHVSAYSQDGSISGVADINVKRRGDWIDDDGVSHASMHIDGTNNIRGLSETEYKEVVLSCIHKMSNNYKAYALVPNNAAGTITARYEDQEKFFKGEYRTVKEPYDSWKFWPLYYEKLSKGYKDISNLIVGKTTVAEKKKKAEGLKPSSNDISAMLYKELMAYAQNVVNETFVSQSLITEAMVRKAKAVFKELEKRKTLKGFNKKLEELLIMCPRKRDWKMGDKIADYYARSVSDFEHILQREENLILAMDAVSYKEDGRESFKDFGIEVFEATKEQREEVLSYLSSSLRNCVTKVYRVKPLEQEKKFSEYCKTNGIKTIKKLWHGSVNSNWASIIRTGLSLSRGVANGRMFGDGIYFAPDSLKSYNYTSCRGTYWARGNSGKGFLGLYATAYGEPYMITGGANRLLNQSTVKSKGFNCCHAKAALNGLRADEIIYYDANAVVLNYIVEINPL